MSFMEMQIYRKGALYSANCAKCGSTNFTHEWFHMDHNERRDAMQAGTLCCDDCGGAVNPETFQECRRSYAGWYSAPGYMDCTTVNYDTNKRRLITILRDMYGEEQ
jgi:hypothetical protein